MMTSEGGPHDAEQMRKKAEADAEAQAKVEPKDEFQVFFSDYRSVDGLQLPHQISRSINGEAHEEMTIQKFKVNQPIKPEKFTKP
jgi:hypothetical protein